MNTHISRAVLSAAALFVLPVTSWAANPTSSSALDDTFTSPPAMPAAPDQDLSGIMMHNGSAYIVHRLQTNLALPDGRTVQPDGTVLNSGGSVNSIRPGEIFSLDGQSKPAPFLTPKGDNSLLNPGSGVESLGTPLPDSGAPNPAGTFVPRNGTFPGVSDSFGIVREGADHGDFSD